MNAPKAKKVPKQIESHKDIRVDPYYWMKLTDEQKNAEQPDVQTKEVIQYLEAENNYRKEKLAHTENLQEQLYQEIIGRIKQTDMSVPYFKNGWYYLTRYEEGKEYPIYARKKSIDLSAEKLLIDVNELAKGHSYYHVGGLSVSPDNNLLAFSEDTISRRQYTLRIKDLTSNEILEVKIENTTGYAVWANDNKTLFYSKRDQNLRPSKIYKHVIGTDPSLDEVVFHEKDEAFYTYVRKSKSNKYIIIGSWSTMSQEYRFLNADTPDGEFQIFQKRIRSLEYNIEHAGDKWLILCNEDNAINFKLMECLLDKTTKDHWKQTIPHRPDILVEDFEIFNEYLILSERAKGLTQLRVIPNTGKPYVIPFDEDVYVVKTSVNPELDSSHLRISYTSMTTPNSTYDFDMKNRSFQLLKQQEVEGGFDAQEYITKRIYAIAQDKTEIPISIVHRKDLSADSPHPVLLYGYGSYGISIDPGFGSSRLSLLDRGFIFAIAHIRGGKELGKPWYESGKKLVKKNTFTDFIACAEHLISENITSKENLFALGGSAGGLLIGAVINMRPDLWKAVIAAVPFVDVLTTMLDNSIPLTTGEYDEWGNPNEKSFYDYIKSYSPYDNIEAKEYPAMLVTTGFYDSQVQYWEPAKWVAKLRELKTDENLLLLYCNMDTGHGGASGRFRRHRETAMEYAFLLDQAGLGSEEESSTSSL